MMPTTHLLKKLRCSSVPAYGPRHFGLGLEQWEELMSGEKG